MSLDQYIINAENIELTGDDIHKITEGKAEIITYAELGKYNNIDDVFNNKHCLILLYEIRQNFGHWVLLIKKNDTIEFFDPYGLNVDAELHYNNNYYRDEGSHLKYLLSISGYKIIVNKYQFQKYKNHVNTCGRHTAFRCKMENMTLEQYKRFLFNNGDKTPDYWVSILTLFI
jgi:hypothetical protein